MIRQKFTSTVHRLDLGLVIRLGISLAALSIALGLWSSAFAQTTDDLSKLDPVRVSAVEFNPAMPHPGDSVEVRLKLTIDDGFHAYVEQYRFILKSPNYKLSSFDVEPTKAFIDPISHKEKIGTEKYAELVSLLDIPVSATSGPQTLEFELTYQACSKAFCLFPKRVPVKTELQIAGNTEDAFASALHKGWLYALIMIFFAGLLTSLTPCIFPLIPITLAVIGSRDQSQSRRKSFFVSLSYVLGMAITYSVLGVVAAKTGSLFGAYLGSPIVVGVIAVLFVLMGLSMYGLFEIQMPQFITQRLASSGAQKGFAGAFASGLIAGIVAGPCVGPVLVSVLAYVAQTQNVWAGFIFLFVFALGMGQLFLVIGTYHNLWHKLPRSGPWLEQVKFVFGTVMIAMAFYYIHPVFRGPIFNGLLATALIAISIFFGAFRPRQEANTRLRRLQKSIMLIVFGAGVVLAVVAMTPPHVVAHIFGAPTAQETKVDGPEWFRFSDELLKKAASEKRAVIVDFKADWCLACKELDLKTFSDPHILALGKNFLWLEYDATASTPELEELRKRFQFAGLPFVAIFDTNGQWRKDLTLTGFEPPERFQKRMQSAESP